MAGANVMSASASAASCVWASLSLHPNVCWNDQLAEQECTLTGLSSIYSIVGLVAHSHAELYTATMQAIHSNSSCPSGMIVKAPQ